MKIDFKNLGSISEGSITLNDLTLLCGKNNSGKTYAMYSLYGLLNKKLNINFDFVKPFIEKLKQDGVYRLNIDDILSQHQKEMIKYIEEHFKKNLSSLFGVTENEFIDTVICLDFKDNALKKQAVEKRVDSNLSFGKKSWSVSLWKKIGSETIELALPNAEMPNNIIQPYISEQLVNIIFPSLSQNAFLLPAERSGLNLFFKELFSIRNLSLQLAQDNNVNPMEILKQVIDARYPAPIKDYLQELSRIGRTREDKSGFCKYAQLIQENVLGGKYEIDDYGDVFFLLSHSEKKLPLHFSSSTVKTLFGLVFYLNHLANTGDYLMIDEPELNLHPDNQRQVARVIAQLVNAGLKVIVSTHSDYFVRELNNLIMLHKEFSGVSELRQKYGYEQNELLDSKRVSAYLFNNKGIEPMEVDAGEGIIAGTFDEVINSLNQSSNEIYYAMQDAKELSD